MPQEHVVSIDPSKPLSEEPGTGHNRWHEDIEPVVEVDPGDTVVYETRDAFDGQLNPESTEEDVGGLNLNPVHPLTGPVRGWTGPRSRLPTSSAVDWLSSCPSKASRVS